jgi:hypothetical protein
MGGVLYSCGVLSPKHASLPVYVWVMEPPFENRLSINHKHKGVPYGGIGEVRDDGDANYGFKDAKGDLSVLDQIPELRRDPALMDLAKSINAPHTGLFSIGCVSGEVSDQSGFRHSGYIEFSLNSASAIADARNYFPLFFHFDRLLHENSFPGRVVFHWELQLVTFIEANASGFTCSIFVNTHYSETKLAADKAWTDALGVLGRFLGSVPAEHTDPIYGSSITR